MVMRTGDGRVFDALNPRGVNAGGVNRFDGCTSCRTEIGIKDVRMPIPCYTGINYYIQRDFVKQQV